MLRRALLPALAAVVLATAPTSAFATDAYAAPVVATPDVSVADRITGTVATEAPYVQIDLLTNDSLRLVNRSTVATTDATPYDFDTTGLSRVKIRATACAAPDDCPGAATLSGWMTPTTVAPTAEFPADTTIGTDNADYLVTISDTGTGVLAAQVTTKNNGRWVSLAQNGTTDIRSSLLEGANTITIYRCTDEARTSCASTKVQQAVSVLTNLSVSIPYLGGSFRITNPDAPDPLSATADVNIGVSRSVTFDYQIHGSDPAQIVRTGTTTTVDGMPQRVTLDLTGLDEGTYTVTGTFSYVAPDFGTVSGNLLSPLWLRVDTTAPVIDGVSFSSPTVFPAIDGYQDSVTVATQSGDTSASSFKTEIHDAVGNVVATWTGSRADSYTWSQTGLPAGAYVARVTAKDAYGRTTVLESAPITLSNKKLTWVSATQTVSATSSMVGKTVGRCSTVASPSLHKWAGSLGLYSGTKCRTGGAAAKVMTVHRLRLPSAFAYGTARISMTGAAAKTKPTSTATFGLRTATGAWDPFKVAIRTNASHPGPSSPISRLKTATNDIYWGVIAQSGSRYDVRSFTISYDYRALR